MAITATGFAGSIDAGHWARYSANLGENERIVSGLTGAVVAGQTRQVTLSSGEAYAWGVSASNSAAITLTFGNVTSGVRWDAVVLRYNWQSGTVVAVVVPGTSIEQVPGTLNDNPGVLYDQAILLVQITAGSTVPTAVRNLQGMHAKHDVSIYARTLTGSQSEYANTVNGEVWSTELAFQVSIPRWAKAVSGVATWAGVRVVGNCSGLLWWQIGDLGTDRVAYGTTAATDVSRITLTAPGLINIPASMRGRTLPGTPWATGPTTGPALQLDYLSGFALSLDFSA